MASRSIRTPNTILTVYAAQFHSEQMRPSTAIPYVFGTIAMILSMLPNPVARWLGHCGLRRNQWLALIAAARSSWLWFTILTTR